MAGNKGISAERWFLQQGARRSQRSTQGTDHANKSLLAGGPRGTRSIHLREIGQEQHITRPNPEGRPVVADGRSVPVIDPIQSLEPGAQLCDEVGDGGFCASAEDSVRRP